MIYPLLLIAADFFALLLAFTAAYVLRVELDTRPLIEEIPAFTFIEVFFFVLPLWLIAHAALGLYSKRVYEKRLVEMGNIFIGSAIGIMLIITFDFISADPIFPARLVPLYAFIAAFLLVLTARNVLWLVRRMLFRYGFGVRRVMLIGNSDATTQLASQLKHTLSSGFNIVAISAKKQFVPEGFDGMHFSSLNTALEKAPELGLHMIIQTETFDKPQRNKAVLETARQHHMAIRILPPQQDLYASRHSTEVFNGFPMIAIYQTSLMGWGRIGKRLFDIVFGLIGFIVTLPILLALAIAIKISDPSGPVFFKHKRITRFGTPFYIYKLRSMYWKYSTGDKSKAKKSDEQIFREMGREDLIEEFRANQKVAKDPRIMPIGRITRATSLDELPQFINVLRGDLSLVGPRAIVKDELKHYKNAGPSLLSVKAGVTGLWQVSGRSDLSYEERVNLDIYYVQNWSFWLDIRILLKTVVVVLKKAGAR